MMITGAMQYVVDIVFIGHDFYYKAMEHFRFSCTKDFTFELHTVKR